MSQIMTLVFIAIGGAFGACSRYLISELLVLWLGRGFPYGTLTVNIIGSFIMGTLVAAFESELISADPWKQIIGIGFLGALTTFSTFSMDNVLLMQEAAWLKLALNVVINVTLCFFVAWAGFLVVMKAN